MKFKKGMWFNSKLHNSILYIESKASDQYYQVHVLHLESSYEAKGLQSLSQIESWDYLGELLSKELSKRKLK